LTLAEEDKLDDTYNIGIQIALLKRYFIKYDMDDVFTNISPYIGAISGTTLLRTKYLDLFTNYSQITEGQVTASNKWYNQHTVEDFYCPNLQLTFEFFINNTTKGVWEKCLKDFNKVEPEVRGGPLLYLIMMKKL
jgi:hypothetical protein